MEIVIVANRERYPGFAAELPDRIVIQGTDASIAASVAERIIETLDRHFVAGSGCDDFYVREDEP